MRCFFCSRAAMLQRVGRGNIKAYFRIEIGEEREEEGSEAVETCSLWSLLRKKKD